MTPYPQQEMQDSKEELAIEPLDYMKMSLEWVATEKPTADECLKALRKDDTKIPVIDYERTDWEPADGPAPNWSRWLALGAIIIVLVFAIK